eukprot:1796825-Prymnesium_polylepis.1
MDMGSCGVMWGHVGSPAACGSGTAHGLFIPIPRRVHTTCPHHVSAPRVRTTWPHHVAAPRGRTTWPHH